MNEFEQILSGAIETIHPQHQTWIDSNAPLIGLCAMILMAWLIQFHAVFYDNYVRTFLGIKNAHVAVSLRIALYPLAVLLFPVLYLLYCAMEYAKKQYTSAVVQHVELRGTGEVQKGEGQLSLSDG